MWFEYLNFPGFKAKAGVFIYVLYKDIVKFMLSVFYFDNTKGKNYFEKIRTGSHSFSYGRGMEESSL